jgi:predicted Fe-Mo cluster-binding NifX family protein
MTNAPIIPLCDFGCAQPATHQFKNGKNCCSKVASSCSAMKAKNNSQKRIELDWLTLQSEYNAGSTISDLAKKYNVSGIVIEGAAKRGLLTLRSRAEGIKLARTQGKGFVSHSAESKAKISEYAKLHHGGYKEGSGRGKKGRYKGQFCDSSWELAYLIYCEAHGKSVVRNTEKFPYQFDGKTKNYMPDFIVDGKYVEIKGYVSPEWEAKQKAFPHDLTILTSKEIEPIIGFVVSLHGKDFVKLYE